MNKKFEQIIKVGLQVRSDLKAEDFCYRKDGKLTVMSPYAAIIVDDDPEVVCKGTDRMIDKQVSKLLQYGYGIDITKKEIKAEIKKRGCKRGKLDNTTYTVEPGCNVNIYYLLDVLDAVDGYAVYWDREIKSDIYKSGKKYYCSGLAVKGNDGVGYICPIQTFTETVTPKYPPIEEEIVHFESLGAKVSKKLDKMVDAWLKRYKGTPNENKGAMCRDGKMYFVDAEGIYILEVEGNYLREGIPELWDRNYPKATIPTDFDGKPSKETTTTIADIEWSSKVLKQIISIIGFKSMSVTPLYEGAVNKKLGLIEGTKGRAIIMSCKKN